MIHLRAARLTRPALTRSLALVAAGAATVLVVGCGSEPANPDAVPSAAGTPAAPAATPSAGPSASGTPGSAPPATPSSTATPVDAVAVDITLENGTVSPNGEKIDVRRGQTVTLTVTSDHDDTVHVHGDYDVELDVKAGTTVMESFVADKSGSVEVESHHPEKIIAILNIR